MKSRKHIIYGWTSKRSRLSHLFRWGYSWSIFILWADNSIRSTKGRRSDWCAADWPPKRVRVTVEEVCKPPNTEPIPLGRWFPVARKVKQTCCKCGHHMHLWLRVKVGNIEMKVTE